MTQGDRWTGSDADSQRCDHTKVDEEQRLQPHASSSHTTQIAAPEADAPNLVIVLHRTQKLVNIGGTIRAMKNMGLRQLRLVTPAEFDPLAIDAIAHRSQDILATTVLYPTLDAALADTTWVIGTTARHHGQLAAPLTPRQAAPQILEHAQHGAVALLFGPEDNGLASTELDRCHQLITIPTDPAYASLNLAQAVLILAYELQLARMPPPRAQPHTPANRAQLEQLFETWRQALRDIQFLKNEQNSSMLRTLRSITHRAAPDTREAALLMAIAREISHALRRQAQR